MNAANHNRVTYYGRNDWSAGYYRDRCIEMLTRSETHSPVTINDAIEAHQCKLMADNIPELFEGMASLDSGEPAKRLFSTACKFINQLLSVYSVDDVFEAVELQYAEQFWSLVETSGAITKIQSDDLEKLINRHPECISSVLRSKRLVSDFGEAIKRALLNHTAIAAELIISRLATDSGSRENLHLPSSLDSSEIDRIMLDYIKSENANPNYLLALRGWPTGSSGFYNPSPEVRVQAKRKYDSSVEQLFANGTGLHFYTGVTIDMNQIACKGLKVDGHNLTHIFSGQWLKKYTDPATILNNLQFIFDYIDMNGLMSAPARTHEQTALLELLGTHVKGEYRTSTSFQMRSGLTYLESAAYNDLLKSSGTSIESALEWAYSEYFSEEYGIPGFTLSLPAKGSSWLDKCKAMGPEIERVIKAYAIYSKRDEVDDDFFPFETLTSFSSLMALEGKKYAIAGPEFERLGHALFSDQCMLAYLHESHESEPCFFDVMRKHCVTRHDYSDYLQATIDMLIDADLILEDGRDKRLLPTPRAVCIKLVWDYDAITLRRRAEEDSSVVESLVNDRILCYCDQLFAPVEADYLDYMFNDASFPNSLALRNRYDHAHSTIPDPQADKIRDDYYRLLSILICITLKINEELTYKTGKGGVENFDDWPLCDESILQTARKLWEKDHSHQEPAAATPPHHRRSYPKMGFQSHINEMRFSK